MLLINIDFSHWGNQCNVPKLHFFYLILEHYASYFHYIFQLLRRKETEIVSPLESKKMSKQLPTLYQYFTEGDISSGLVANDRDWFELNGKKFRIFSGSLHYFRVHPDYWRDRLKKYRAAGLNAIDVWVVSGFLFLFKFI